MLLEVLWVGVDLEVRFGVQRRGASRVFLCRL